MKQILALIVLAFFAVTVNASTVTWGTPAAFTSETTWTEAKGKIWLVALGGTSSISDLKVLTDGSLSMGEGASIFATDTATATTEGQYSTFIGFTSANLGTYALVFMDTATNTYGVSDSFEITDAIFQDGTSDTETATATVDFSNRTDASGSYLLVDKPLASSGVPEPTVLALLALGVAGLALKRKVA